MSESSANVSRRKFILVSSAAIAVSPFLFNLAGMASTAKAEEKDVMYVIGPGCIGCHFCFYECPESAIHWGQDKYVIDQDKCVQCGTCAEVCNISAPHSVQR